MPRYYAPITKEALKKEIVKEGKKSVWIENENGEKSNYYSDYIGGLECLKKDLSKVIFDHENCCCREEDAEDWNSPFAPLVGIHNIDNFVFCGVVAGGDWEEPVFYIIYWDGKKLRAYIPTEGNTWNRETKTAYGSEDERGDQYEDYWDREEQPQIPKGDVGLLLKDIQKRIQPYYPRKKQ